MFGGTDAALRALGFLIGLLVEGSLWVAGRAMWRGVPLLSLTVFGLNVMVIRYGDSIRAYGLATACIVLTMAAIWLFIETPALWSGIAAAGMALLSVQALYQNSVLVFALCVAAAVVFFAERQTGRAVAALAIGFPAALSLTPYIGPLFRAQEWWAVSKAGLDAHLLKSNIVLLTGHPLRWFRFVWLALAVIALLLAAERATKAAEPHPKAVRQRALFAGTALVLAVVGFAVFLFTAQLPTELWYFLVPLGFVIVCCDAVLADSSQEMRAAVVGMALVAGGLASISGVRGVEMRQTDGDLVALELAREAAPGDLIVVNPWYFALTFERYYRGAAQWATLPPLADYSYHRYDLLKVSLQQPHPARPVLDRAAAALESGHRVWIAGWIPVVPVGKGPPRDLPPAPQGPAGWFDAPYEVNWGAQLEYLIATRSQTVATVPVSTKEAINPLEDMGIIVASRWRAHPLNALTESRPASTGRGGPRVSDAGTVKDSTEQRRGNEKGDEEK